MIKTINGLRHILHSTLKKLRLFTIYLEIRYQLTGAAPQQPTDLEEAIDHFVNVNKQLWQQEDVSGGRVLIEGHLSDYGINYLFRTAIAASAIREEKNVDIDVVYNGYPHQWVPSRKGYGSFGINNHIYLDSYFIFSNLRFRLNSRLASLRYRKTVHTPDDILKIKFGGIPVGDLIYDDILKLNDLKTISVIDKRVIAGIQKAYYFYLQYKAFFKRRKYRYFVSTHSAYSEYGLLCRVALKSGVSVLETTDIQTSFFEKITENELPTYHQGIKNVIDKFYGSKEYDWEDQIAIAKQALYDRIESKVPQIDVQRAYRGREYSREELADTLGFKRDRKTVFILAHIFSDSPHISSKMIHADYYAWLEKTIAICSNITDVDWVVKPHPACALYGENGLVEKMIPPGSGNIALCPEDFNTKSIRTCADVIVTVHGTAGLEFACFGIPVILAGKPFYAEMGFTIEPQTSQEYTATLKSVSSIPKLSDQQINIAFRILAIWNTQFDWFNPIITTEVLANVWGSEIKRDPARAYTLLTENLKKHNPRKLKLWEVSRQYISGGIETHVNTARKPLPSEILETS